MARQAELERALPTTLPDDFDHWDSAGLPPATLPDDFDDFDEAPAPRLRSSALPVAVPPPAPARAPVTRRASGLPRRTGNSSLTIHEVPAVTAEQPAEYVSTEELSSLVQAYRDTVDEELDGAKRRKRNLVMKWTGAVVLLLAVGSAVFVLKHETSAAQSPRVVVVQHPVVTYTPDPTPFKEKPSPAKPAPHTTETSAADSSATDSSTPASQ